MYPPNRKLSRREMLSRAARATVAAGVASGLKPSPAGEASEETSGEKELVWDVHGHLTGVTGTPEERIAQLLHYANRMGIDRLIIFMGVSFVHDPSPKEIRQQNDDVLRTLDHSKGRVFGFVYLNPKHVEESLKEIDRCIRDGPMVGVKLWVAVKCHEKCLDPIVQRAAELKAPILQHTWAKITGNLPGESTTLELAKLAARHPQASFIAAHVDGNWEPGIRAVRPVKNVYAEICGSDPAAGMVEMAVRELGAERVIYGSDFGGRSFASQLAKVYSADIPETAKRLILGGNIQRVLQPIFQAKGIKP